jgi:hypothetical protein
MAKRCLPLLSILILTSLPLHAQTLVVTDDDGLASIRCEGVSLSKVFERLGEVFGVELILGREASSMRLTADVTSVPLTTAVEQLLDGTGVDYALVMDPLDWSRVGKILVDAGSGDRLEARGRDANRTAPERPTDGDKVLTPAPLTEIERLNEPLAEAWKEAEAQGFDTGGQPPQLQLDLESVPALAPLVEADRYGEQLEEGWRQLQELGLGDDGSPPAPFPGLSDFLQGLGLPSGDQPGTQRAGKNHDARDEWRRTGEERLTPGIAR